MVMIMLTVAVVAETVHSTIIESIWRCRRHTRHGFGPGSGGSSRVGNGNPFQCSCLENSMDRGVWWATVHGVTELDTTERLITHTH